MNDPRHVNINLAIQPDFNCPKCKGYHFHQVARMKMVSGILVGSKAAQVVPAPVWACVNCHYEWTNEDVEIQLKEKGSPHPALTILPASAEA